jgi:legumain
LIAFPSGRLHSKDLIAALQNMHSMAMYKQLVFYVEACESGSMFPQMPTNIGIYAATAANAHESSWGFYCPPDDKIHGREVGSCLGDTFSISWMEDTDLGTAGETLQTQYENVVTRTTKSHPLQFGDLSITKQLVADWIGPKKTIEKVSDVKQTRHQNASTVDSRDIKLHYLIWKHSREMSQTSMDELNEEIVSRKNFDTLFANVGKLQIRSVRGASNGNSVSLSDIENAEDALFAETDCYEHLLSSFESKCGKWSDYGFKYFRQLYNLCYHVGGLASNSVTIGEALNMFDDFCAGGERVF